MKVLVKILLLFILSMLWGGAAAVTKPVELYRACLDGTNSTVTLLWHTSPDACNSFTKYKVYGRESSFSSFKLLKEVFVLNDQTTVVTVTNLKRWEFYIVTMFACDGKDSFTSKRILVDNINPAKPQLDSISVLVGSSTIVAGWRKSVSKDVKGYYLYKVVASNVLVKNTVNTTASVNTLNPSTGTVTMSLAAYDSCGNTSAISTNHKTIYLSQINDKCTRVISLSWSPYVGWSGIDRYDMFAKKGLNNYKKIGTVSGNTSSFKYYHNTSDENICIYIRAFKGDKLMSSTSNTVCFKSPKIHVSSQNYMARVTCENNKYLKVIGRFDITDVKEIVLKKKNLSTGLWNVVKSFAPASSIIFSDVNSACTDITEYQFTLINNCDSISTKSKIAHNVVLKKINKNELNWVFYSPVWLEDIDKYELYEKDLSLNSSTWNKIYTANNTDDLYIINSPDNKCYKVMAIEDVNNKGNKTDSSLSNEVCFFGENHIYYPTAFNPSGVNNVFYPKGVSIDYSKSLFSIYNRWGEEVYKTNDIKKGWDGRYKGKICQEGVYIVYGITHFLDLRVSTCKQTIYIIK